MSCDWFVPDPRHSIVWQTEYSDTRKTWCCSVAADLACKITYLLNKLFQRRWSVVTAALSCGDNGDDTGPDVRVFEWPMLQPLGSGTCVLTTKISIIQRRPISGSNKKSVHRLHGSQPWPLVWIRIARKWIYWGSHKWIEFNKFCTYGCVTTIFYLNLLQINVC